MRSAALVSVLLLLVRSCAKSDPNLTFELACDSPGSLEAVPLPPDFQGQLSPEDVVAAISPHLPPGTWTGLNDTQWILVDADDQTIGHAAIRVVTENAVETFPENRYLTEDVE